MFMRNTQDDSRITTEVIQTPIVAPVDFESETIPHLDDVYRTALHLCLQSSEASEVVQETYLRARATFDEYRRSGMNCKVWLFQTLFELVRSEHQFSCAQVFAASAFGKAEFVDGSVHRDEVLFAMNRVPLGLRAVLLLVDCQGFSYDEAAKILGHTREAVTRYIVLGRNYLQSELEACHSTLAAGAR